MSDIETDELIDESTNINDVDINEPEPDVDMETGEVVEKGEEALPY